MLLLRLLLLWLLLLLLLWLMMLWLLRLLLMWLLGDRVSTISPLLGNKAIVVHHEDVLVSVHPLLAAHDFPGKFNGRYDDLLS